MEKIAFFPVEKMEASYFSEARIPTFQTANVILVTIYYSMLKFCTVELSLKSVSEFNPNFLLGWLADW